MLDVATARYVHDILVYTLELITFYRICINVKYSACVKYLEKEVVLEAAAAPYAGQRQLRFGRLAVLADEAERPLSEAEVVDRTVNPLGAVEDQVLSAEAPTEDCHLPHMLYNKKTYVF